MVLNTGTLDWESSALTTKKKNCMTTFFIDGVQLPQGYSHFEEEVYFLLFSSQKYLVLIFSTSEG